MYQGNNTRLLDIGIGVHTGKSPFKFASKDELLIDSSGAKTSIKVIPDSQGSYLSLPKETCDAIADELPITLDSSGYYLWDTDDSKYQEIVSSPAYLSFTFPSSTANGAPDDVVIKVPFMLLNLTLGPVFSGQKNSVQYFPCMPFDPSDGNYFLGRAFLQAALIGRNWEEPGIAWLAQAPGPGSNHQGLGLSLQDIQRSQNILEPISGDQDDLFGSSWSGYWDPLVDSSPSANSSHSNSGDDQNKATGLSTGAKAGIGAGVGALALLSIVGLCLWMRKKRKSTSSSQTEPLHVQPANDTKNDVSPPYSAIDPKHTNPGHEMQNMPQDARLQGFSSASELSGMTELPGGQDPRELGIGRL